MNNPFTPGPWKAHEGGTNDRTSASITGPNGEPIASFRFYPRTPDLRSRADANARLSAAAPDLLAALDHIGGLSRALRSGGPDPDDLQELSDALHEAVDTAHAAIARATEG